MLSTINRLYKLFSIKITTDVISDIFFQNKRMNLNDFLNNLSTIIDKEILRILEKEGLKPIGGQLKIRFIEDTQNISVFWDFYFQDRKNEMIRKSSERLIKNNLFTEEAINFIKVNNVMYPITAPSIAFK